MEAGIVPVKRLDQAKSRLADAYGHAQRAAIARALMEDALELCRRVDYLTWFVVSDDQSVIDLAEARGLVAVRDAGAGLNQALLLAMDEVLGQGARSVTIIPADVPLTAPEDIADLIDTGATSDVVLVPSGPDGGTNGLYMRPPGLIHPSFGVGSLGAHAESARVRSLRCSILGLPRMELDIDTPDDVDALLATGSTSRTATVLRGLKSRD
jgi:2-phospho-L-lactate/phosphoenolpyruvate guanylyltransferase